MKFDTSTSARESFLQGPEMFLFFENEALKLQRSMKREPSCSEECSGSENKYSQLISLPETTSAGMMDVIRVRGVWRP